MRGDGVDRPTEHRDEKMSPSPANEEVPLSRAVPDDGRDRWQRDDGSRPAQPPGTLVAEPAAPIRLTVIGVQPKISAPLGDRRARDAAVKQDLVDEVAEDRKASGAASSRFAERARRGPRHVMIPRRVLTRLSGGSR